MTFRKCLFYKPIAGGLLAGDTPRGSYSWVVDFLRAGLHRLPDVSHLLPPLVSPYFHWA
jgi:hypothetical protein